MNQTNPMLADEDMDFLNAVAARLTAEYGNFRINLSHNTHITNSGQTTFTFTGIDQIVDAKKKITLINGKGKYQLIMPSTTLKKQVIGELFGMVAIADPACPPQQFLIQPYEEKT